MADRKLLEILKHPHSTELQEQEVSALFKENGEWHSSTYWRCRVVEGYRKTHSDSRGQIQGTPTKVKVKLALTGELCMDCFTTDWGSPIIKLRGYEEIAQLIEMKRRVKSISSVNKSTSASAVQKRLNELSGILIRIEERTNKPSPLREEYEELLKGFPAVEKKLRAHSQSDAAKADLEKTVQKQLVPAKFRDQSFSLDSTMMMIGISPTPSAGRGGVKGDTVSAIIDAFSIRKDSSSVLYAPAYFYSYLLGALFFRGKEDFLVVSAAAPEDPEARDNAAYLWDPQNESVLACLSQATNTGKALSEG